MEEAQIATCIFQHDARNLRLKRRLAERGIDWRNQLEITCRFRAASQQQASQLAKELSGQGFVSVAVSPASGKHRSWPLKARLWTSIDHVVSHEFTEEMVRSAAAISCTYDGWEAQVT
jgi:hypothetical protein